MRWMGLVLVVAMAGCAAAPGGVPDNAGNAPNRAFTAFYNQFKASLSSSQRQIFADAFAGAVRPYRVAQRAAKNQPELTRSFEEYVGPMLKAERVAMARGKLAEHRNLLHHIHDKTGVPPQVVVALWGVETSFGRVQGAHPVIPALTTLAWESHRRDFYNRELHAALDLIEQNSLSPLVKGSWAGAVGQPQFMPSTYLRAGVDGNDDGRVDLFDSLPDVFASTANLLRLNGWQRGLAWRIKLAEDSLVAAQAGKLNSRGLSEPFAPQGMTYPGVLPDEKYRYYRPTNGPGFLLGPNFSAVLKWNNSSYFAYSVLALADMLDTNEAE